MHELARDCNKRMYTVGCYQKSTCELRKKAGWAVQGTTSTVARKIIRLVSNTTKLISEFQGHRRINVRNGTPQILSYLSGELNTKMEEKKKVTPFRIEKNLSWTKAHLPK